MKQKLKKERWVDIEFDAGISEKEKFRISSYGRILNCKSDKEFLVTISYINGYQNLPLKQKINGKSTSRYVHKLVAQHFLEKKEGDEFVIHLNYDKKDNNVANLKWATKAEKEKHQYTNPEYLANPNRRTYSKLSVAKVKLLKRKIHDPNRRTRMKMIARQFGISEMQLYRIKSGENWSSVTDY